MSMTPQRPYLVRAIYAWIVDNGMTPHLLVDATQPHVHIPPGTAQDGKVVLNIATRATQGLELGDDAITFSARFNGVSQSLYLPMAAIIAVYARETGAGMGLPPDPAYDEDLSEMPLSGPTAPKLVEVPEAIRTDSDTPPDDDTPPAPKRGGHLRIVK